MLRMKLRLALVAAIPLLGGLVLVPTPADAGPAMYYVQCFSGRYYSAKMSVTRLNVMSCTGGILRLHNRDAGTQFAYDGNWCIMTGQRYTSWTGWQILNSDCRGWAN